MNYHGIQPTTFNNGEGIRTALWVAGCNHHCKGCQNAYTWDEHGGQEFGKDAKEKLFRALDRTWCDGLTLTGGDPLFPASREEITSLAREVKTRFPDKNIWVYTGYKYEEVQDLEVMQYIDVLVDGRFVEELADPSYKFAGSTNQRIIRVKERS